MPALPWKTFRNVTREREYVVLLSELPLKSYLANRASSDSPGRSSAS